MPIRHTHDDAPPAAPVRPAADECCRSGCETCVFDLYETEMERYRIALKIWQDGMARKAKGRRK